MSALIDKEIYLNRLEQEKEKNKTVNDVISNNEKNLGENNSNHKSSEIMDDSDDVEKNLWQFIINNDDQLKIGKHFESICVNNETNSFFISSTNLTTSSDGFVHKYNCLEDIPDKSSLTINMKQSSCKELIYNDKYNKLIAGYDTGAIMMFDNEFRKYSLLHSHDDFITGLTFDPVNKKKLISVSVDCSMNVWDMETSLLLEEFQYAHAAGIQAIDFVPNNEYLLITCGLDNLIINWDLRTSSKPSSKYATLTVTPSTIKWSKNNDNTFFIGTTTGLLIKFDSRKLANDLGGKKLSDNCIYKMRSLSYKENSIALCMKNELIVIDENSLEVVHKSICTEQNVINDFIEYNQSILSVGNDCNQVVNHFFESL